MLPPYYRIEMFGGLCLIADGDVTVRFHSEFAAALLACVAYRPDVRCRRAEICHTLWSNLPPGEAILQLNAAITTLRMHLEPAPVAPGRVLCLEGDCVFLAPGTFETDVTDLRNALALTGPSYTEAMRRQALTRAMLLYTGELLAGMNLPWVTEERERWAIIHAAVKYEWEKRPVFSPPIDREAAPPPARQSEDAVRSPLRPTPGPRRYARSGGISTPD